MWTYFLNTPPDILVIAAICAIAGAIFLWFAGLPGVVNVLICLTLLFAAALAANWLATGIVVPFQDANAKALIASLTGVGVASVLALLILPRPR